MTLAGTRPPLISETNLYELHHRARLAIKKAMLKKETYVYVTSGRSSPGYGRMRRVKYTVKHKSYFTDEQGYLILPQNLKIGHYRIALFSLPL